MGTSELLGKPDIMLGVTCDGLASSNPSRGVSLTAVLFILCTEIEIRILNILNITKITIRKTVV